MNYNEFQKHQLLGDHCAKVATVKDDLQLLQSQVGFVQQKIVVLEASWNQQSNFKKKVAGVNNTLDNTKQNALRELSAINQSNKGLSVQLNNLQFELSSKLRRTDLQNKTREACDSVAGVIDRCLSQQQDFIRKSNELMQKLSGRVARLSQKK